MVLVTENQLSVSDKISRRLIGLGIRGFYIGEPIKGPVVTGYPIKLPSFVPVQKLINKSEDLALAADVESVDIRRIGNEIVVFIPNKDRKIIDFKEVLYWRLNNRTSDQILPIILGMNFRGEKASIDLTTQPHILIAGSTGAGKSVLESAIISSLSMIKGPEELELYLVDTKRVDLGLFDELPHVKEVIKDIVEFYPVINNLYEIAQVRSKLFETNKVRNISEYNEKNSEKLPYIVLIIDELADLIEKDKMERNGDKEFPEPKVTDSIKKLIQICRASGIHIIACTQRTSVKVIEGDIKANFPTRISLKLPTKVDSMTILGETGAEKLLGRGDMLVKRGDSDVLERFHGPFVKLDDIEAIINHRDMILAQFRRKVA